MKWKKSFLVVMVLGIMVSLVASCAQAEEAVPATEQPATAPDRTRPAPPEGVAPGDRPSAPVMDLAAAAAKLGVTEQQLRDALGDAGQRPLNLATAAEKLGISEGSLREALGLPEGGFPPGGPPLAGPGPTGSGQSWQVPV